MNLTQNGKGHRALAILATGPAGFVRIFHAAMPGAERTYTARRKVHFLLTALCDEGAITHEDRYYAITPVGLALLRQMGPVSEASSVRIFARTEGA